jgi:ribosomal protein L37AE/L43A
MAKIEMGKYYKTCEDCQGVGYIKESDGIWRKCQKCLFKPIWPDMPNHLW